MMMMNPADHAEMTEQIMKRVVVRFTEGKSVVQNVKVCLAKPSHGRNGGGAHNHNHGPLQQRQVLLHQQHFHMASPFLEEAFDCVEEEDDTEEQTFTSARSLKTNVHRATGKN
jgi:hypothetical protein